MPLPGKDSIKQGYLPHQMIYSLLPLLLEPLTDLYKQNCISRLKELTRVVFSEEEREQLRKFTNKSYLLDKRTCHQVYLSLVDILLAYCCEVRVTGGEKNVESPWSIRKLSATLCWLETFSSIPDVLVSFGRRVLCYPLYRHFRLVTRAFSDTAMVLQLGKSAVLKCLLDIHKIFRENDPAYILNDLYISDYCIWIQKTKNYMKSSGGS
ncbi:PREDICTED: protein SHQ1 homolog [Crocodylus porosus]|uniref:protein SHQ1 homolog n=1 Tax=Crocodylus porosus TaxID=8502 RepID=UPI00093EA7D7|nr:PREDICTED: protein SHQ1 homolog [Crocodylus porosus]